LRRIHHQGIRQLAFERVSKFSFHGGYFSSDFSFLKGEIYDVLKLNGDFAERDCLASSIERHPFDIVKHAVFEDQLDGPEHIA
jgi:hypothetical protein